jgi:hypothetical protein
MRPMLARRRVVRLKHDDQLDRWHHALFLEQKLLTTRALLLGREDKAGEGLLFALDCPITALSFGATLSSETL